jgi:type II secretory pathway component PulL
MEGLVEKYIEDDIEDLHTYVEEWDAEAAEIQTEVLHDYCTGWDYDAYLAGNPAA